MTRDRTVRLALWALALACFGLGVLGFGPDQSFLLAAVFAAVTAEYRGDGGCGESRA